MVFIKGVIFSRGGALLEFPFVYPASCKIDSKFRFTQLRGSVVIGGSMKHSIYMGSKWSDVSGKERLEYRLFCWNGMGLSIKFCHWNGIGFEHEILSLEWNGG